MFQPKFQPKRARVISLALCGAFAAGGLVYLQLAPGYEAGPSLQPETPPPNAE